MKSIKVYIILIFFLIALSINTRSQEKQPSEKKDKKEYVSPQIKAPPDYVIQEIIKKKSLKYNRKIIPRHEDNQQNRIPPSNKNTNKSEGNRINPDANRCIDVTFDISQNAINAFVSRVTFPHFTGTFPNTNITYETWISTPYITLHDCELKANFTIYVITFDGIEYHEYVIPVSPDLIIYEQGYSFQEIRAFIVYLPELINGLNIPQIVKDLIIQKYEDLDLPMYPGRLLELANSYVPPYMWLNFYDYFVTWGVLEGKMRLYGAIWVETRARFFHSMWLKRAPWRCSFRFFSNVDTYLKYFKVYNILGEEVDGQTLNMHINKDSWTERIDLAFNYNEQYYYVRAYFSSPYGIYMREWEFGFFAASEDYWKWFGMGYIRGIN